MQSRRPTRSLVRQTTAENAPSVRAGSLHAPSKVRVGSGLSKAAHDPNIAKPIAGASSKVQASKSSEVASVNNISANVKRKRDALSENLGKTGKPKPIATDKENHNQKPATAYVEVPLAAARQRTTVSTTSTRHVAPTGTTTRRRIVVKRDEEVIPVVPEETRSETSPVLDDNDGEAMTIDEVEQQSHSTRHTSTRSSASAVVPVSRRTSANSKKLVTTMPRPARHPAKQEDLGDVGHIAKKRRTSSVGPADEKDVILQNVQNGIMSENVSEAEAHALVEEVKWDDLDKEDEGDPLMVSEYVSEIFNYLRELEIKTMPQHDYIDRQKDLAWKMRGILMDWLVQVHMRFKLLPETLFLAVNIVDRFLSARVVSLVRLQLVGITAVFIAAKYEEILAPSVVNFVECSDSSYTEKDILDAEKYILRSIDYNLGYPNPIHFLRRATKADGYDVQVRTIAKYLIEISCVDWKLLPHTPSRIAAAAMWLARLVLEKPEWDSNLMHYSGYKEAEILPTAQLMVTYLLRAVKHGSFFRKYSGKKFLKVSVYMREWLWVKFGDQEPVEYDEDGERTTGIHENLNIVKSPDSIKLSDELPRLREEIRLRIEEDAQELLQTVNEAI